MSDANRTLPATKADLVARIQRARASLEEALGKLTRDQMLRPGPERWSIKDHLAHLVAWQQIMIQRDLGGKSFAEAAGMDAATAAATAHMTAETGINDYLRARDRDLPIHEVLDRLQRSFRQLLEALESLDETALAGPSGREGISLVEAIASDSYEHDQEHERWIREIAGLAE
jgi:hypothetical protein